MVVEEGDTVTIDFEGYFDDGKVFDSTAKRGEPLVFVAGKGEVISGFDWAVIGMEVGQEKMLNLDPEEAYGPKHKNAIQKVSKDKFPSDVELGKEIDIPLPTGEKISVRVEEIEKGTVTLDANYPLAGKNLNFKIKVIEILKKSFGTD